MPETIISQFQRAFNSPIEIYRQVATPTERDNIPSGVRWPGMLVYVVSDGLTYSLSGGGVDNGSWELLGGLQDAPSDGQTYGRKDGNWELIGASGDYVDKILPVVTPATTTVTEKNQHLVGLTIDSTPIIRKQTHYWNGSGYVATIGFGFGDSAMQNNEGAISNGFGHFALRDNIGSGSNGFGNYALENNTGESSSGFGSYALQNNTGSTSNGFGYNALQNNIGSSSNGFGYNALLNNTGVSANGFGRSALLNNTGASANGFGHSALLNNTGASANGFGRSALLNNTGASANGFGHSAMQNNEGAISNGFGNTALLNNTGSGSNGFGHSALRDNTGNQSNGFGHLALQANTGLQSNGFGNTALQYNEGSSNNVFGYQSFASFYDNVGDAKAVADNGTDIDTVDGQITITSHGFGANGSIVNLRYNSDGALIAGLQDNVVYQVEIINANTFEFRVNNITSTGGAATHTFTPQSTYSDVNIFGSNLDPIRSNQTILGGTAAVMPNSTISDIESDGDKALITKEYADANYASAASGSFTTTDAKTVTVVNGIITSIV